MKAPSPQISISRGATSTPVFVGAANPLEPSDLAALAARGRTTTSVQRMRASHHKVARLVAYGLTHVEVAALTGYTRERVNQLVGSPAMRELIDLYMDRVAEREAEQLDAYLELKTQNMIAAERHIADAFAEADENDALIPIRTALAISADGADRLGYGKRQTNVNINADLGAALERAIARSGKAPHQIEGKATRTITQTPSTAETAPSSPTHIRRRA